MINKTCLIKAYCNNYNKLNMNCINDKNILNTSFKKNESYISKSVEKYFPKGLEELKFHNNILTVKNGVNYKAKTLMSGYSELYIKNNRTYRLFDKVYPGIDNCEVFSEKEVEDIGRTNQFIDILTGNYSFKEKLGLLVTFYPNIEERKARFQQLGAVPGKMIQLNNSSEKVFFSESGFLYTQDEIDNIRNGYMDTNYFEWGYNKNSKFIMDGKEFKLDDTGHLNIPKGTLCIQEKVEIIK